MADEFNYFNSDAAPSTSPELLAALERARNHKMTPQEIFEQRVSFVSEGKDKDAVRKRLIEAQGYPAEASERAAIVAWLRREIEDLKTHAAVTYDHYAKEELFAHRSAYEAIADAIERGEHLAQPSKTGV